jgi:ParB family transcriptional regulator, chromosome partitioning protein
MTTQENTGNSEFQYLLLGSIIVEEQIRSKIDMQSESFKALMESIKDKGVLEPVLVTPKDDKYLLLCGERRYLAAQKLLFETIPARVIDVVNQKDEILAFQLTENLQREDLNPIDQAKGILAYFQARHPDTQADNVYNVDEVMSDLVSYNRSPEYVSDIFSATVAETLKISGKSIRTLHRTISLLKLVPKIQEAILAEKLPLSQGYLFAANLGSPDFFNIFDEIMEKPVTNAKLEKMLTAYKKAKSKSTDPKPIPMKIKVASLQATKSYFETKTGMYTKNDLQILIEELKVFLTSIELQAQTAPDTVPEKKPVEKPRPQI